MSDAPIKLFGVIPVEVTKSFGAKLMEHALCNLQEVLSVDDGCQQQVTYCKDHGLFFLYENSLPAKERERQNERN